jgi:TetR/AcrR family transcriptional regulator, cholesterol catabolism regulator
MHFDKIAHCNHFCCVQLFGQMTKSEVRNEQILDAAGQLFKEQTFEGTTTRDIAERAGILLGSLHYQYKTKDLILEALMARGVARARQAVDTACRNEKSVLEKIRLGLGAHLKLLCDDNDASLHVFLYDFRSLKTDSRKRIEKHRATYESFWDSLLQEAVDQKLTRPGINVQLIRQFGFGALNWVPTWHSKKSKQTLQHIADTFFQSLAFGLISQEKP